MTDFSWTCVNQSDVFSKTSTYSSSNWQLTITKLDTSSTCTISMSYSSNVQLVWTGSYDLAHGFTEASYYSTLDGPIAVTNQPDVRDAVMSYINSTHADARVFIPQSGLSWTGGQSDYELPSGEAYCYYSNVTGNTPEGWIVGIVYSVTANPTFTVTVNYVGANGSLLIYWEGLYRNGAVVETDYIWY
jgi:hypothetical protein